MKVKPKGEIISIINFSFVYLLLSANDVMEATTLTKFDTKSEKLILKPIELIDLILKDYQRPEKYHETDGELRDSKFHEETVKGAMEGNREVDKGGVARKVWSRWSKWGECSVTCGCGAKTRQKLCLAGRCAPGEREEQRRPCHRKPCELN